MTKFPSEAFFDGLVAAFNADPEAAAAASGWTGELAIVVDGAEPFIAWARPGPEGIAEWRRLTGFDELEALAPAYQARASADTWRGLLERRVDPVHAVLFGQLKLRGELQPLIARLRFKGLGARALAAVGFA